MGREKDRLIEKEENWLDFAQQSGKRCRWCECVLDYNDYKTFGNCCNGCYNYIHSES